jgi:flagellar hook capping protein FlgD
LTAVSRATVLLVLVVLAGTAVAFAETERLKIAASALEGANVQPVFSPVCRCSESKAEIRLRVHRPDDLTVTVLDSAGRKVRVLALLRHVQHRVVLYWNGRDQSGALVPDGTYSVHVQLELADRTIDLPKRVVVDTVAPSAQLVGYQPHVLTVAPEARVVVHYRLSEPAHAVLYVNGKRVLRTYSREKSAAFKWYGVRRLRRGRYRLQLAGLDLAGNLGARTPVFILRVPR